MQVSFVIPAHNAEATLAETVESLQAQTDGRWEAIIVNDGSTDDTLAVAARLAARDARLRVITQPQGGESSARNAGIDAASFDWMVFLDADDWLLPTYLERITARLAAEPSLGVVHCGYYLVTPNGQRSRGRFAWWSSDVFEELTRRNVFAIHTCMVRRSLVQAIGKFDITLRTAADWDFWQRVARAGARFGAVPEALACYRVRPGSASFNARQILDDSLTVITRGHQPDPRVSHPAPAYAQGMPGEQAPRAKLDFSCWAAGLAIGQGEDARPLLDSVVAEGAPELSPERVAAWLFDAVPFSAGQLDTAWAELWPRVERRIEEFLIALEARSPTPGLAASAGLALMELGQVATSDEFGARSGHDSADDKQSAAERESQFRKQENRIAKLEQAKAWLEQQVANWQSAAAERDGQIRELKTWIDELEQGKTWLAEQRQNWQRLAEEREQRLQKITRYSGLGWLNPGVLFDRLRRAPGAPPAQPQPETAKPSTATQATAQPSPAPLATPEPNPGPFATPRRVVPVSREWGFDRGLPIDRYYIEGFLAKNADDVLGRVLEIGDNSYTLRFGGDRVVKSDILQVTQGNPQATIVADLAQADHLSSDTFDCIIFTQTLQLIYDARAALRTLWRILKPGGVLLATCPGLTQISQTEWADSWYWRFTQASINRLLKDVFSGTNAEVHSHGNVQAACAFLYGLAVEELSPEELDYQDPDYEVILTVRAVKPEAGILAASAQERTQAGHSHTAGPDEPRALVLMYHRIVAAEPDPWAMSVTPDHFNEQLQVLQRDFQPVRLHHLAQGLAHGLTPGAQVAITFDDGYSDNLYHGLPLLEQYGVPATFFITTAGIAQRAEFWWDTLERLWLWPGTLPETLQLSIDGRLRQWDLSGWAQYREVDFRLHRNWFAWQAAPTPRHAALVELWRLLHALPPETRRSVLADLQAWAGPGMTEPRHRVLGLTELRAMARSKLVEFGAHTVNHPSLAGLPHSVQQAEILGSRRWLEEALERPVRSFSYPFGRPVDYSPQTITLVREAGFEYACVNRVDTVRPDTDPFQLPRLHVANWAGDDFARRLSQWFNQSPVG